MMTHDRQIKWILVWLVCVLVQPVAARMVVYVDDDALGENDGSSWVNAYNDLQSALAIAGPGNEIWVAEGIYVPSDGQERDKTFKLEEGAAIYGGFGGTEESRSERDLSLFETVLSGDIGVASDDSDNCHHVVVGSDDARLDGFTISGGSATDARGNDQRGAGMLNDGVSPVVANCIFRDNEAEMGGGAIYNDWEACPTIINGVFLTRSSRNQKGRFSSFAKLKLGIL